MDRTRSTTASALLVAVLAVGLASPALAAAPRLAPAPAGTGFLESAWFWLAEHLPGWTALRGESGSYMDPNGGTTSAATPIPPAGTGWTVVRGESGSYMDPDGRTTPQVAAPPTGSALAPQH